MSRTGTPRSKAKDGTLVNLDTRFRPNNAPYAVPAAATAAQTDALGDSIERTVWLSHLDPLGTIGISITREGSSAPVQ